jgi:hypothetical protein
MEKISQKGKDKIYITELAVSSCVKNMIHTFEANENVQALTTKFQKSIGEKIITRKQPKVVIR